MSVPPPNAKTKFIEELKKKYPTKDQNECENAFTNYETCTKKNPLSFIYNNCSTDNFSAPAPAIAAPATAPAPQVAGGKRRKSKKSKGSKKSKKSKRSKSAKNCKK